jgi:acyl-CoA thioesterase-1
MTTSLIKTPVLGSADRRRRTGAPAFGSPLRRWLAVLILAGFGSIPAVHGAPQPTLLVLGDSISAAYGIQREAGWVQRLEQRLSEREPGWKVVNASVSGETTGGGLARLPAALEAHDPDVVVIELGGNDGLRGYPLQRIRANLERMVGLARDAGAAVLLVGMQIPPNYGPPYAQGFAALFAQVAESHDVPLVPFLLERVALEHGLMQEDGIHPTAEAQPLLLDTVWPHLEPLLQPAGGGSAR